MYLSDIFYGILMFLYFYYNFSALFGRHFNAQTWIKQNKTKHKQTKRRHSKNFFSLDLIYIFFLCVSYKLTLIVLFFYAGQAKNLCFMLHFVKELKLKWAIFRCISVFRLYSKLIRAQIHYKKEMKKF